MKLKKILTLATSFALASSLTFAAIGCGSSYKENNPVTDATPTNTDTYNMPDDYARTYYEIFVRSFADGDGDGIGDFRGLIDNLDYLNDGDDSTTEDLGINGIWLMPINKSTTYHKYDVVDYYDVDREYGTLDDFDELVKECKKRGIRIQMDLVLNHTSSSHPDFAQALKDARMGKTPETSKYMARYVFVLKDEKPSSGIYHNVSNSEYCYLGNFDSNMPDRNLANEEVREDIKHAVDFWLERGVYSFRLDAVPWAFADSTAYNAENGEFWTWFNDYCDKKGKEVYGTECPDLPRYCYNIGEVLTMSHMGIAPFYGTHMSNFNYALGGDIDVGFPAAANGKTAEGCAALVSSLVDIQNDVIERDKDNAMPLLSNFLSGHDNNRSAGFFGYDPLKIKKAAGLYLLAPGNAYIYYGEEIGAAGSGVDPNKRLPFNWGDNRDGINDPPGANYSGEQKLGSWKDQTEDPDSILTYYRNAIKLRNRFPEIARGKIEGYALDAKNNLGKMADVKGDATSYAAVNESNKYVAAYTLTYNGETLLIVHNIGENGITIKAKDFADCSLVGSLKIQPGKVDFNKGNIILAPGTTAVIKKV